MSELTTPIKIEISGIGTIESADLYLKSEVDKVISDLEESHKMEVEQLLLEIVQIKRAARTLRKKMNYWKQKFCKAMAKFCSERIARIEKDYAFWRHGKDYASNFYKRWRKRWLELAEKFKEAK